MANQIQYFLCCQFNPVALRKAKIVCNFGHSECNMVKRKIHTKENIMLFKVQFTYLSTVFIRL